MSCRMLLVKTLRVMSYWNQLLQRSFTSVMTKALEPLPKHWVTLPLFGHWFAINVYHNVKRQLNSNVEEIVLEKGSCITAEKTH